MSVKSRGILFAAAVLGAVFSFSAVAAPAGGATEDGGGTAVVFVKSSYVEGPGARQRDGHAELTADTGRVQYPVFFKTAGEAELSLSVKLPAKQAAVLEVFAAGGMTFPQTVKVTGTGEEAPVAAGRLRVAKAGQMMLVTVRLKGRPADGACSVGDLTLSGTAAKDAVVNVNKGAQSVHYWYDGGRGDIAWFYNEVSAEPGPTTTYYQVCGFSRGYFGIQRNSETEKRVIFSVWDAGNEAVDRNKVAEDNRTKILYKGEGVFAGDFGHEGTGGHSHWVYPWKENQTYRFLVGAIPDGGATVYVGYFYLPEKRAWKLIAAFRAPKDGHYLSGLYSFIEDFGGSGNKRRTAHFGNSWVRLADGTWREVLKVGFSHGNAPGHNDYGGALVNNRFMQYTGGFVSAPNPPPGSLVRKPTGTLPDIDFSKLERPEGVPPLPGAAGK